MINALTALRFYVMITIFLSHLTFLATTPKGAYIYNTFFDCGSLGVAFFFVLSGFVINLGYGEKFVKITKKEYFNFIKKRVKKTYPLYILTMIIMFIDVVRNTGITVKFLKNVIKLIISVMMLQTLVPIQSFAQMFNGAAWFLSCITILYLITPFLLKWNMKIRKGVKKSGIAIVVVLLIFELATIGLSLNVPGKYRIGLLYCSPYVRVFYFVFGILLANIYIVCCKKIKQWGEKRTYLFTSLELVSGIAFLFVYIIISNYRLEISYFMDMLVSGIIIFVFSCSFGKVSKFFERKVNVFLGGISFEFYLIHYPLIVLGWRWVVNSGLAGHSLFGISLSFFVLSIILAIFSHWIIKEVMDKIEKSRFIVSKSK